MIGLLHRIRQSLPLRVGLYIVIFVTLVFLFSQGFLFVRSRELVRQEAIERATKALDRTTGAIVASLNTIEVATHNVEWFVMNHPVPDSLLSYSRRIVELFPDVSGCSITMEPDYFPASIGHFSAYTVRKADGIYTVREGDYDYYSKPWYRSVSQTGAPCWVDPYDDYNAGTLSNDEMIVSYSMPLHDASGRFVGVVSTDLSLPRLSRLVSSGNPYPHSYSVLVGRDGRFFVHPDTMKMGRRTISQDADYRDNPDIILLAHEMFSGRDDYMKVDIGGQPCFVFYQPLPGTTWTIAQVCPDKDVMGGYNKLAYIILLLVIAGLLFIFIVSLRTMRHFIAPLNQLVRQSRYITSGHFGEPMGHTGRQDVVGQLQNSFADMQQLLNKQISQLQQAGEEAEQRNRELVRANVLAQESGRRKQAFIQDVSHQIRTPLNIIQGFLMVLRDSWQDLPAEDRAKMTDTMYQNATLLQRMVNMLVDASWLETSDTLDCSDLVCVNDVAREAVADFHNRSPYDVELEFQTSLPDNFSVTTNRVHLLRILRELLYNAKKYASHSSVRFLLTTTSNGVSFAVEDHGPGIPDAERERVFSHFQKLDSFSEGLGLGLHLSLRFARLMGGELTLDTSYHNGCRFVLGLPQVVK